MTALHAPEASSASPEAGPGAAPEAGPGAGADAGAGVVFGVMVNGFL